LQAELDVLQKTKMIDTAIDVFRIVNKEKPVPQGLIKNVETNQ
jgi:hypothetical protein